jgi:hypothetical protein
MKKTFSLPALILVTAVPVGFAVNTTAWQNAARGQTARSPRQATLKGAVPQTIDAQAMKRLQDVTRYRGTEINPHPDASDDARILQLRISNLFAQVDPVPPLSRVAHFAWLNKPEFRVNGWYGTIQSVVQDGNQTLVRVRISPHIASDKATITSTTDYCTETYAVTDFGVQFLGSEPPPEDFVAGVFTD